MFHNFFSQRQLSILFKISNIITLTSLIGKALQIYYIPEAATLHLLLNNISNTSFGITTYIIISQNLIYFENHHKKLYKNHFFTFLLASILISMSIMFLLLINKFIKFYIYAFEHLHNPKIIYLLFITVFILIIDLYFAYKNRYKINYDFSEHIIMKTLKFIVYKIAFISTFYIASLHNKRMMSMVQDHVKIIRSIFIIYIEVCLYIIVFLSILFFINFLYKKMHSY